MRETIAAIRIMGFWSWLYHSKFYRAHMRLAHKYNWHHTKVMGPFPDGSTQLWCQWCGLRYSTPAIDYALVSRLGEKQCGTVGKTVKP